MPQGRARQRRRGIPSCPAPRGIAAPPPPPATQAVQGGLPPTPPRLSDPASHRLCRAAASSATFWRVEAGVRSPPAPQLYRQGAAVLLSGPLGRPFALHQRPLLHTSPISPSSPLHSARWPGGRVWGPNPKPGLVVLIPAGRWLEHKAAAMPMRPGFQEAGSHALVCPLAAACQPHAMPKRMPKQGTVPDPGQIIARARPLCWSCS